MRGRFSGSTGFGDEQQELNSGLTRMILLSSYNTLRRFICFLDLNLLIYRVEVIKTIS